MTTTKDLANNARNSISDYCINECKAFCCRKGFLFLSLKEMDITVGEQKDALMSKGFLTENKAGKFVLNIGNPASCPSLKDNRCLIHKNLDRNSACKDFPIFVSGKTVKFSERCPAVRDGKFYLYAHEFKKRGFTIE